MNETSLIAAIGTPLTDGESLHIEGLEAHLTDQWNAGMAGVLVGGTMGAMQMLTDATYRSLVDHAIQFSCGRGEVMVGVGDTSLSRTLERIRFLNERSVDAIVVLTPYFFRFSQAELLAYFRTLADRSRTPVFLYDLPVLTKVGLEFDTVRELARHPQIRGIKCSGDLGLARQLIDSVPPGFRVVVAQPHLVDVLLHHGIRHHLDGVFSLAPTWAKAIQRAAEAQDWEAAAVSQKRLSSLLSVLQKYGVFPTFSLLANARQIPGNFMPAPFASLSESQVAQVLNEPVVRELLHGSIGMERHRTSPPGTSAMLPHQTVMEAEK